MGSAGAVSDKRGGGPDGKHSSLGWLVGTAEQEEVAG